MPSTPAAEAAWAQSRPTQACTPGRDLLTTGLFDHGQVAALGSRATEVVGAKAAQLAECSGNERYFAVADMIFRTQRTWATASDPIAELAKGLRIAGMGDNEVKACLANTAIADAVVADYRGGEALGVNSTPTIFVNGEMFKGGRSVDEFDALFTKLAK